MNQPTERICPQGPLWLEYVFMFLQSEAFYWTMLTIIAFCAAIGLLALFQPLYDLTHWRIQ